MNDSEEQQWEKLVGERDEFERRANLWEKSHDRCVRRRFDKYRGSIPAKVGTMPAMIVLDRRTSKTITIGKRVRFRNAGPGEKWHWGIVARIDPIAINR